VVRRKAYAATRSHQRNTPPTVALMLGVIDLEAHWRLDRVVRHAHSHRLLFQKRIGSEVGHRHPYRRIHRAGCAEDARLRSLAGGRKEVMMGRFSRWAADKLEDTLMIASSRLVARPSMLWLRTKR
jgi:hypothetical protein